MNNMAATSLDAFHNPANQARRTPQRTKVLSYVRKHPLSTREEIANGTGLRLASVCGRVNELMKDGQIHVSGRRDGAQMLEAEYEQQELQL